MRVIRCKHNGCTKLVSKETLFCDEHVEEREAYIEKRKQWGERNKQKQKRYNKVLRYSKQRTERESFYHTKAWKNVRQQALERDNYQCQYCKLQGIIRPGNIADHIVPTQVDDTNMTDLSRLATSCHKCHDKKTRWEQAYYGTGYNKDGTERGLKNDEPIKTIKELEFLFNPPPYRHLGDSSLSGLQL